MLASSWLGVFWLSVWIEQPLGLGVETVGLVMIVGIP